MAKKRVFFWEQETWHPFDDPQYPGNMSRAVKRFSALLDEKLRLEAAKKSKGKGVVAPSRPPQGQQGELSLTSGRLALPKETPITLSNGKTIQIVRLPSRGKYESFGGVYRDNAYGVTIYLHWDTIVGFKFDKDSAITWLNYNQDGHGPYETKMALLALYGSGEETKEEILGVGPQEAQQPFLRKQSELYGHNLALLRERCRLEARRGAPPVDTALYPHKAEYCTQFSKFYINVCSVVDGVSPLLPATLRAK